jgi:hypothetical protein
VSAPLAEPADGLGKDEMDSPDLDRRRLRIFALLALVVVGLLGGLVALFWPQGGKPPAINLDEIESLDFELRATSGAQEPINLRVLKPELCRDLAEVLNGGREVPDRADLDTGYITFRLRDGGTRDFGIFSGPSVEYYYFRAYQGTGYKVYRVPRAAFREAVNRFCTARLDDPTFK